MESQSGDIIETTICEGERQLGRQSLPVDGFASAANTVYEFGRCYWHGHGCSPTTSVFIGERDATQRLSDTNTKKYFQQLGYTVISLWECDWRKQVDSVPTLKAFLHAFHRHTYGQSKEMTFEMKSSLDLSNATFGFLSSKTSIWTAVTFQST